MVRGMPLLMVIFWVYFFVPVLTGYPVTGFVTMLCALVIYDSAYLGEIVRAGIQALPHGQTEAARALGLSYIGDDARGDPAAGALQHGAELVSQFVSTIKETSLGYIISVQETHSRRTDQQPAVHQAVQVYLILGLTYFVLCCSGCRSSRTGWSGA